MYNPVSGWASTVLEKTTELKEIFPNEEFEVIVVNDGSDNDNYINEKIEINLYRLIEYPVNKGKGNAIRMGVQASTGDVIIYTDIDFPYEIESVAVIINALKNADADIVIGVKDRSYYDHIPPVRLFISRLFRFFVRLFLRIPTDDTQCGLKGFDQKGKELFLKTTITRYLFDLEFIFIASRDKNIKIKTQEIKLRDDVQFRTMNLSIIKNETWNFIKILIRSFVN